MRQTNIAISGYYGFENLGDEALIHSTLDLLESYLPEAQITVLSRPDSCYEKAKTFDRNNYFGIWKLFRQTDLFLSGGGGLLQDSTGPKSCLYYMGLSLLAHWRGAFSAIYSQGLGPIRSSLLQRWVAFGATRLPYLSFRDTMSMELLESWGARQALSKTHLTSDPALCLQPITPKQTLPLLKELGIDKEIGLFERPAGPARKEVGPLVAVSLRPWPSLEKQELIEGLKGFKKQHQARYVFLPFQHDKDFPLCQEIWQELKEEDFLLTKALAPKEMTGLLRCFDLVLGMRLHSLILGATAFQPGLGLSYDPKVTNFCQRSGLPYLELEKLTGESLCQHLEHSLQARSHLKKTLTKNVQAMQQQVHQELQNLLTQAGLWSEPR